MSLTATRQIVAWYRRQGSSPQSEPVPWYGDLGALIRQETASARLQAEPKPFIKLNTHPPVDLQFGYPYYVKPPEAKQRASSRRIKKTAEPKPPKRG